MLRAENVPPALSHHSARLAAETSRVGFILDRPAPYM